jgi:hypothetical protein
MKWPHSDFGFLFADFGFQMKPASMWSGLLSFMRNPQSKIRNPK